MSSARRAAEAALSLCCSARAGFSRRAGRREWAEPESVGEVHIFRCELLVRRLDGTKRARPERRPMQLLTREHLLS